MSIDARVDWVKINEDGSGELVLKDRPAIGQGGSPGIAGQKSLRFEQAPEEVTALNGMDIWGNSKNIMLGDVEIATRIGYTQIAFVARPWFLAAVDRYGQKKLRSL